MTKSKSSTESLFSAGICSAPPYLHRLFNLMYGEISRDSQKHALSQIEFSKRVDKILDQKARIFMQNPPQSGEALQAFMCDLLAEYKCPTNKKPSDLLNEINYPYGSKKLSHCSTTFCFCNGLSYAVHSHRKLINFVTVRNMYAAYFSPEKSCAISVSEFCQRAQSFFEINLTFDDNMQNCFIARISLEKDSKGSQNKFFEHSLSFLECQKEQLYSLYSQLLKVIYTEKTQDITEEQYKKRQLNAIFLLAFLIGSNPPMFHGTGGAFVADAMLQILLVSVGFPSMPKNFLSLTEVELLFKFANPTQESWDSLQMLYLSAQQGETNEIFHPQSAGPEGLLHFLERPFFKTLFFIPDENNTVQDLMRRKCMLQKVTGYEQRDPDKVYQNCYSALQFNLRLFIDNFDFIKTVDPNTKRLMLFENHFGISFKDNEYLLHILPEYGKLIETEQRISKAARAQITILSKMRMAGCIGALVFVCFAAYTSQEGINDVFRCTTTSKDLKDQLNHFLIFSNCYFIPVVKILILYLTAFLCASFAYNKNKELGKELSRYRLLANSTPKNEKIMRDIESILGSLP